jgi:uncharacterized membrane protein YozB (DUF420 family)
MSVAQDERTPALVRFLGLAAVVAVVALVPPYLIPGRETLVEREGPVLDALLTTHVTTAGAAILVGTLQLVPRIRARRTVHRRLGRAFLGLGVVAFVVTGLPLALTAESTVARYGLLVPVLLWPVFAVAGWRAIRRRDIATHRRWMIRLYAVTFFAITARMVVPLLMLLQLPMLSAWYGGEVEQMVEATIPIGQWVGWIVNLTIAEWVLRRSGGRAQAKLASHALPTNIVRQKNLS